MTGKSIQLVYIVITVRLFLEFGTELMRTGWNRTGYFIVCYLVEKMSYTVQDALDEFAVQKPPGIKHEHFVDALFLRYCVGLKKTKMR